jgi:cyclic dehypoxanthinyl futalosine synthase
MTFSLDTLGARILDGGRLSAAEALWLYRDAPTMWLGRMADAVRRRKHPHGVVTYIIDRNVNYTNVCVARCNFCAFYRTVGHAEGYVLGFDEIHRKIDETMALGGNQLLLQGGHNARVVRRSLPRHQGEIPRLQAARALAPGDPAHREDVEAAGA